MDDFYLIFPITLSINAIISCLASFGRVWYFLFVLVHQNCVKVIGYVVMLYIDNITKKLREN